jgi:hypothetical protein
MVEQWHLLLELERRIGLLTSSHHIELSICTSIICNIHTFRSYNSARTDRYRSTSDTSRLQPATMAPPNPLFPAYQRRQAESSASAVTPSATVSGALPGTSAPPNNLECGMAWYVPSSDSMLLRQLADPAVSAWAIRPTVMTIRHRRVSASLGNTLYRSM